MGAWGAGIEDTDTFLDVYEQFFDAYNNGASPDEVTATVRDELVDYFADTDDQYDAHFALALAQWETQSLDEALLQTVAGYIESGAATENWRDRDADESTLKKHGAAASRFLKKLRKPRASKKRRRRQKFVFSKEVLVQLRAPDNRKTFTIAEHYTNGEYTYTLAVMLWANGGGRVFSSHQPGLSYAARWVDAHSLEIEMPGCVKEELAADHLIDLEKFFFAGDLVNLHCRFV